MIKTLNLLTLIILLPIANSFAQEKENISPKKVAFVVESLFFDKKFGIKDVSAFMKLEINKSISDSQDGSVNNSTNNDTVYNPAKEKLYELLKQIEIQNNLITVKIYEADQNGSILALDQKFDLTKKIISFINNKSSKSAEAFKVDFPEAKIGSIDTRLFYDKDKGIKHIIKNLNKYASKQELCSKTTVCIEIGNAIHSFAMKKGFALVLDSSKTLPNEIAAYPKTDITQDFIADFNKTN